MKEKHFIAALTEDLVVVGTSGTVNRNSNSTQWFDVHLKDWVLSEGDVLYIEFSHLNEETELTTHVGPLQLFYNPALKRYVTLLPPEVVIVPGVWKYSVELRFNYRGDEYDSITSAMFSMTVLDTVMTLSETNAFVKETELISAAKALASALSVGHTAEDVLNAATKAVASAAAANQSEIEASLSAQKAKIAADAMDDIKNRFVKFVPQLPEDPDEDYIYAIVSDENSNLFTLYTWYNGEWLNLGGKNILDNGCRIYEITLSALNWKDNKQIVSIELLSKEDNISVEVYPDDESAAEYVACGITSELNGNAIEFTCGTVPTADILMHVEITFQIETPIPEGYYTKPQADELFETKFSASSTQETVKKNTLDIAALKTATSGVVKPFVICVPSERWEDNRAVITEEDYAELGGITNESYIEISTEDGSVSMALECEVEIAPEQSQSTITLQCVSQPTEDIYISVFIIK